MTIRVKVDITQWASLRGEAFFLPPDANIIPSLGVVSLWANSGIYEQAAVNTFLQVADYYLVAHVHASN